MSAKLVPYATVDVFTRTAFGGNPLAVVTDARGLDAHQMQSIAAEFNYSETSFVLPPEDPANTARVRIFTQTDEVPFAGHPNVGTAFVLRSAGTVFGRPVGDVMAFEEAAGLVRVTVTRESDRVAGAEIEVPRPLEISHRVDVETIAACASLGPQDVDDEAFPPLVASVGLPLAFAQVRSLEALARAAPATAAFAAADRLHPTSGHPFCLALFVVTGRGRMRARVFAPLSNVTEDPATGSAAAALGACIAKRHPDEDCRLNLQVEQGVELGRPSLIDVQVVKVAGVLQSVRVSGSCVPMMRGTLALAV